MAIRWTTYIWENRRDLAGPELLTALAIADHANQDGRCFPGLEHLARKTRRDVRQVKDMISKLEQKKVFEVARGIGRGNRTVFQFLNDDENETFSRTEKVLKSSHFTPKKRRRNPSEKGDDLPQEKVKVSVAHKDNHIEPIFNRLISWQESRPLPETIEAGLRILLDRIAVALGRKNSQSFTNRDARRWREAAIVILRDQLDEDAFCNIVEDEFRNNARFYTPERCIDRLIRMKNSCGDVTRAIVLCDRCRERGGWINLGRKEVRCDHITKLATLAA